MIAIDDDIHGKTIAIGEGVDMVKGEGGVRDGRTHQLPCVLLDDMEH